MSCNRSDSSGGDVVAAGELWRDYQLANAVENEEEGVLVGVISR